jgi:hypothetical protein
MEDELLGRLSNNALHPGTLDGSFAYGGRQIPVCLTPDKTRLPQCLALARAIVSEITQIDERAKNAATDGMLYLYNENWREYGEFNMEDGESVEVSNPELTEEEFKSRLTLTSVSVYADRSVSLSYDIDDLFAGHEIVLSSVTTACRNFHVELGG